jgi:hypothetical protein
MEEKARYVAVSRKFPMFQKRHMTGACRIICVGLLYILACVFFHQSVQAAEVYGSESPRARAAIVDHLSVSYPNPVFVKACKALLEGAGYAVDYYPGKEVTVEFYRNLPAHGYEFIVLRVHSAYIDKYLSLAMFTNEPFDKHRYVYEQLRNRVACGYIKPYHEGDPRCLVITDKFVRHSMKGSFANTVIIMMGCDGVKKCMATAFLEKGAQVYIGWDGPVSAVHTDRATMHMLRHLLAEGQTIGRATMETMQKVGYEPQYKSSLLFWPIEAGSLSVQQASQAHGKAANQGNEHGVSDPLLAGMD